MDDRAHRVARAGIAGPSVRVDLADAEANSRIPLGVQPAPPEEAVVAELEPGDGIVGVEVEQEMPVVALAVADVRHGEAVRLGLPKVARIDAVPGHGGAPTPPLDSWLVAKGRRFR